MDRIDKIIRKSRKKMARKDEVLFENEWAAFKIMDDWYTYIDFKKEGVAVLAYDDDGNIWVRMEHCPPHVSKPGELLPTSITGQVDEGYTALATAAKELEEETGFSAEEDEFFDLGWVYPSKASNFRQYLYAVNVTGKEKGDIVGDGTEGEKGAYVEKWSVLDALEVNDPSIGASIARLRAFFEIDLVGIGSEK